MAQCIRRSLAHDGRVVPALRYGRERGARGLQHGTGRERRRCKGGLLLVPFLGDLDASLVRLGG